MSEHILKPCPFCGSGPMLGEVRPATRKSPPLFGITCIHCGAEMTDEFVPELIQRWNARAAATASIDKEVMEGAFDKERRDVAARLWKHIGKPLFTGQDVEDIIGVQRSGFDVVLANASYRRLADLIEPTDETCELELTWGGQTNAHVCTYECTKCGKSCDNVWGEDYEFCPYCGRRIENAEDIEELRGQREGKGVPQPAAGEELCLMPWR